MRPSFLYNGISYTGKMAPLYWKGPLSGWPFSPSCSCTYWPSHTSNTIHTVWSPHCLSQHSNTLRYRWTGKWNRADARFAPSQWETPLLCNDISHWLAANLASTLWNQFWNITTVDLFMTSWLFFSIIHSIVILRRRYDTHSSASRGGITLHSSASWGGMTLHSSASRGGMTLHSSSSWGGMTLHCSSSWGMTLHCSASGGGMTLHCSASWGDMTLHSSAPWGGMTP